MSTKSVPEWNLWEDDTASENPPVSYQPLQLNSDANKLIEFLIKTFLNRRIDPSSSSKELWFIEGQRFVVATILRICENGVPKS